MPSSVACIDLLECPTHRPKKEKEDEDGAGADSTPGSDVSSELKSLQKVSVRKAERGTSSMIASARGTAHTAI